MTTSEFQPYVGPRPFERREEDSVRFFGRSQETQEISSLIFGHPITLVYAQSGAGKTSLFNTSVVLKLEEKGFDVLPLARVGGVLPKGISHKELKNLYVFNALLKMDPETAPKTLISKSLPQFLETRFRTIDKRGQPCPRAIIFDQFEELFTYTPEDWREQREAFFSQVVDALNFDPLLRVVFVIREDFLAELDPFAPMLPENLRIRYRLERLGENAALRAIKDPLINTQRKFAPGVAEELVKELLAMRAVDATGKMAEIEGQYVEPVQLQVVCVTLWSTLEAEVTEIQQSHLKNFNVNDALSNFYKSAVESATKETGVPETNLRNWFGRILITPMGTRSTVFRGEETTGGIENNAVDFLESRHIIRAEFRAGARWYELTHDRLVEPILKNNRDWFDKNLSLFQRQVELWDQQGRPEGMLLRGNELEQAKSEALSRTTTKDEDEFLAACQRIYDREKREKRGARLVQILAVLAFIAGIFALGFGIRASDQAGKAQTALYNEQDALQKERDAAVTATYALGTAVYANTQAASARGFRDADRLSFQARDFLGQGDTVSLGQLLAVEAYKVNFSAGENEILPGVYQALYISAGIGQDRFLSTGGFTYASFGSGANDSWLIVDETLWNLGKFQSTNLVDTDRVLQNAFQSNGQMVVVTGRTRSYSEEINIYVKDKANRLKYQFPLSVPESSYITDVTLSGDGRWVAATYRVYYSYSASAPKTGGVQLWDTQNPSLAPKRLLVSVQSAETVAITQDGSKMAVIDSNYNLYLWKGGDTLTPVIKLNYDITNGTMLGKAGKGLQFSQDGRWLVAASGEALYIFDTNNTQNYFTSPLDDKDQLTGILISPKNDFMIYITSSYEYCYYYYFDAKCTPTTRVIRRFLNDPNKGAGIIYESSDADITAMDISENLKLVIGDEAGYVRAWDLETGSSPASVTLAHSGKIVNLIVSPDGTTIMSYGEKDGTRIWNLTEAKSSGIVVHRIPSTVTTVLRSTDGKELVIGGEYRRNNNSYVSVSILSNLENPDSITELFLYPLQGSLQMLSMSDQWIAAARTTKNRSSGEEAYFLDLWDRKSVVSNTLPITISLPASVKILTFDQNGETLIVATREGELWMDTIEYLATPTPGSSTDGEGAPKQKTLRTKISSGQNDIQGLTVIQGGKYLIGAGEQRVKIWDITDSTNLIEYNVKGALYPMRISSDQKWMVIAGSENEVHIYDLQDFSPTDAKYSKFDAKSGITQFAFSPDNSLLAVATKSGKVLVYQMPPESAEEPIYSLDGSSGITWLEFSTSTLEGIRLVAVSGYYGFLWDLSNPDANLKAQNSTAIYLSGHRGVLTYGGFTNDGRWVITVGTDQTLRFWSIDPNELIKASCLHAGRNLTRAEWNSFFSGEPHETCPGFNYTLEKELPTPTVGPTETPGEQIVMVLTDTLTPTPSITFITYTVSDKDTLGGIALRFYGTLDTSILVTDNNITNVNIIVPGQILKIRVTNTPAPP